MHLKIFASRNVTTVSCEGRAPLRSATPPDTVVRALRANFQSASRLFFWWMILMEDIHTNDSDLRSTRPNWKFGLHQGSESFCERKGRRTRPSGWIKEARPSSFCRHRPLRKIRGRALCLLGAILETRVWLRDYGSDAGLAAGDKFKS